MSDAGQKAVEAVLRDELGTYPDVARTARTVLAVLSETHAVVELPEPGVDGVGAPEWAFDDGSVMGGSVTVRRSDGRIGFSTGTPVDSPPVAERIAAALLAAARVADAGGASSDRSEEPSTDDSEGGGSRG